MEELAIVQPLGCDFVLNAPARHAPLYTERGYEPFSTALFRLSSSWAEDIVDIGAHVGYYSLVAASANSSARIIAVEGSPENADVLRENARINSREHIEVLAAAFSDNHDPIRFQLTEASDNSGRGGHPNSPTVKVVEVDSVTGDELSLASGRRLLIKLDVEGFELAALRGLEKAIDASSEARLLVEFNPKCIRPTGVSPSAILEWLADHGFRMFGIDEDNFTWNEVDIATAEDQVGDGYTNIWCLPRESTMTVAAVMHSAGLSGSERSHVEAVADLVTLGCMVATIMPKPDSGLVAELKKSGSGIMLVEKYEWWVDSSNLELKERHIAFSQIYDSIAHINPDVVMTQTMTVPQGALAARALGKPHVWWVREFGDLDYDFALPESPSEFGQVIRSLSDVVLTNSNAVKQHLFPHSDDAVHVLWPSPLMQPSDVARRARQGELTLGIVASLQVGKGHADLIQAIARSRLRETTIRLKFFGAGSVADRKRLRSLAKELDVSDRIEFVPHMANRAEMYGALDIVVVTSRAEAFGRIPFEATAAGRPVIYAASGGIVEYMVPGETGLSYEPGDIDELARNITTLHQDASLPERLVAQADTHFRQLFSQPARGTALRGYLTEAITRHASLAITPWSLDRLLLQVALTSEESRGDNRNTIAELRSESDALRADRDALRAELTRVSTALHEITVERNNAVLERDALLNSRLWRFAKPYRKLRAIFRPPR
ncbi:unannotated protein [freshwater metagenome]|uniref:Unannotated protein n=1 Tax=freshwater metagenome TaxID=449393 RepID=A0A6J6D8E2_9ZZZZ|nr:FkbM family methyltransferase [Actinomycetota bacterium]